jgi:hypothetical protein
LHRNRVLVTNWPQCLAPGDHLIQHGGERVFVLGLRLEDAVVLKSVSSES